MSDKQQVPLKTIEADLLVTSLDHNDIRQHVLDSLEATDFTYYGHIFSEIRRQDKKYGTIDPVIILDKTGENVYSLPASHRGVSMYEVYTETIKNHSQKKYVKSKAKELESLCNNPDVEAYEIISELKIIQDHLDGSTGVKQSMTPSEILEMERNNPKKEKLVTGEEKFDEILYGDSGLKKGDYHTIMADSGHGKTQYAMYLASKLLNKGYKGLWVQLEDYGVSTAQYFGAQCGKNADNIHIIDSVFELDKIEKEVRVLKKQNDIDFVVIDYIQNVRNGIWDRTKSVERTSSELAKMFVENNVLGLVLSQVTINDNDRSGWSLEPNQNDVRLSQQIKQDSMAMTAIFRPSKIDSLVGVNAGEPYVKDWGGNSNPYQSVWARQVKIRGGKQKHVRVRMFHTDRNGLQLSTNRNEH